MRASSILWLFLVVTGLVACWDWTFEPDLLQPDGAPIDAALDQSVDAPGDSAPPEGGADLGQDLTSDLPPDLLPPDTTKPCPGGCSGVTPICDTSTGTCQGCQSHAECPDELCAADGSCPAANKISYVDKDSCGGAQDGSKSGPYCKIDDAIGQSRSYVLVRQASTPYGDFTVDKSHDIYAEPGTEVSLSACGKAILKGGATIRLQGFIIKNGGVVISEGAKVTLAQNRIGPSACVGIDSSGGSTVVLERNFIFNNTGGGMDLDSSYTVQNNIIVHNSADTVNYGGVKLKPASLTNDLFVNNTVADNTCKASTADEACGVRCETGGTKLINNLFWGNDFNVADSKNPDPALDRQYGAKCQAEYSLEQLKSGVSPTGTGNITDTAAGFAGTTPSTDPADYHLGSGSKAIDNGAPTNAPSVDYDGDDRPQGSGIDIGADERL